MINFQWSIVTLLNICFTTIDGAVNTQQAIASGQFSVFFWFFFHPLFRHRNYMALRNSSVVRRFSFGLRAVFVLGVTVNLIKMTKRLLNQATPEYKGHTFIVTFAQLYVKGKGCLREKWITLCWIIWMWTWLHLRQNHSSIKHHQFSGNLKKKRNCALELMWSFVKCWVENKIYW